MDISVFFLEKKANLFLTKLHSKGIQFDGDTGNPVPGRTISGCMNFMPLLCNLVENEFVFAY